MSAAVQEKPAARSVNPRVAREVMGWEEWDGKDESRPAGAVCFIASGHSDYLAVYRPVESDVGFYFNPWGVIGDAMAVVEKLKQGGGVDISVHVSSAQNPSCFINYPDRREFYAYAPTPAEAICLAALKATENAK